MPTLEFGSTDIAATAQTLVNTIDKGIICFYGPMGTGKTTLIKAMLENLGATDVGHSPTFGLVNEYHDTRGKLLAYHFDFYRINSLEEALDIGLEAYLDSNAYILIEWPGRIEPLLPTNHRKVSLQFIDENTRRIHF